MDERSSAAALLLHGLLISSPVWGQSSGEVELPEGPIDVSNVMLLDPSDNKPTRVGMRVAEDGEPVWQRTFGEAGRDRAWSATASGSGGIAIAAESENVDEDILRLGHGSGAVEIDLMQPIDPDRSPRVHVPTLNHVGLWIDDLHAAVKWLEEQGVRFTPGGIRKGASGYDVCFLHPKGNDDAPRSGEGVLIELVQAPADLIAAL